MEKLVLIDGNSLINRAFYATPLLTTKDGVPTNAVYAFMNMLVKIINDVKPNYITVAFDLKAPTFRHKIYAEYKGKRKPMPDALVPQIPLLKEVLDVLNIHRIEKEGLEADDLIATLSTKIPIETIVITGDKDSFQLVDNLTSIYFTRRGITDIDILNVDNFTEKTGIIPSQVPDLKALMGDASDNIPGVPGVGEKTALTLVQTYGSIENLYEKVDEVTGKLKEKLIDGKDSSFMSKYLATVKRDCDIDLDLDKMKYVYPFTIDAFKKFRELDFKTLLKREDVFQKIDESEKVSTKSIQSELKEILDIKSLENLLTNVNKIALSFINGINIYDFNGNEYSIKIKEGFLGEGLSYSESMKCLKTFFEDANKTVYLYGKKETKHSLESYEIDYKATIEDVSLMKYLADYNGNDDDLKAVMEEYSYDSQKPATAIADMYEKFSAILHETNMESLYKKVELPLADVLYSMENEGFKIDIDVLDELSNQYTKELKVLEEQIYDVVGEKFNINSPKQLAEVLFEKLKLPHGKKKNGSYTTNAEQLEEIEDTHAVIPLILQYRKKKKLLSTYIDAFRPIIERGTGLIHTSFNQVVTSTGRLSSKEPNLQNIPIRDEEGKAIRKMFIARDCEHILIGADYSQIELRLMAHFSNCEKLINAFASNKDIHTATASEVFGVSNEEVNSQMRRRAKAVNFGIIYGISDFGLAKSLKIPTKQAGEYIKTYFEKYPEVKAYMDSLVSVAEEKGYAETLLGRRRYIRELNSPSYQVREFGKRAAMNMPLQGSSADIIKVAMVNVSNRLVKEHLKSRLILQIHDELIIDALKSEADKVKTILVEEMENAVKLKVKLSVETEVGERWYDAK